MARNTAQADPAPAPETAPAAPGAGDFITAAIENAKSLITAKRSIQSDIQAARDFLNHAVRIGAASDEQAAWILENLPKRTRKGKDDDSEESDGGTDE